MKPVSFTGSASRADNGLAHYNMIHQTDLAAHARAMAECGIRPRVLDMGCGRGRFLAELAASAEIEQFGIDIHDDPIRSPAVAYVTGSAEQLPFDDSYFDLSVSTSSLGLSFEPLRAVEEAYRVLKPGGWGFIHLPFTLLSMDHQPLDLFPALEALGKAGFCIMTPCETVPVTLLRIRKTAHGAPLKFPFILAGTDSLTKYYSSSGIF